LPETVIKPTNQLAQASVDLNSLLDYGPWTLRQKLVVLLAALTVMLDGMDIQMMGFAVPAIAKDWGLTKASFAPVLATGLFGVAIGTAIGGLIGDRFGRRIALLANVLLFAVATLAVVLTHSITAILVLRFAAGLGIGGALPNAATLTAEFTPSNRRPFAVTSTIVCIPLGGLVAGLVASNLLPMHSWRLLFAVGGAAPLVLLGILALFLPESPRFLARDPSRRPELAKAMGRIGRLLPDGVALTQHEGAGSKANVRVSDLLGPDLARDSVSLWIAFFLCLTCVYLAFNWLPSVLAGQGFGLKQGSQGLASYNFGGILGALTFGFWINFKGSRTPMIVGSACAIASGAAAAWLLRTPHHSTILLFALICAHGLFVNAVQTTLYALAAHRYATPIRATGVATALAIGRTGAILSAFLGALVLRLDSSIYFALLAMCMVGVLMALVNIRQHIGATHQRNVAH
jgi:AAHS family 4-hydroxybenzoate transporter-like MFS transporter